MQREEKNWFNFQISDSSVKKKEKASFFVPMNSLQRRETNKLLLCQRETKQIEATRAHTKKSQAKKFEIQFDVLFFDVVVTHCLLFGWFDWTNFFSCVTAKISSEFLDMTNQKNGTVKSFNFFFSIGKQFDNFNWVAEKQTMGVERKS